MTNNHYTDFLRVVSLELLHIFLEEKMVTEEEIEFLLTPRLEDAIKDVTHTVTQQASGINTMISEMFNPNKHAGAAASYRKLIDDLIKRRDPEKYEVLSDAWKKTHTTTLHRMAVLYVTSKTIESVNHDLDAKHNPADVFNRHQKSLMGVRDEFLKLYPLAEKA